MSFGDSRASGAIVLFLDEDLASQARGPASVGEPVGHRLRLVEAGRAPTQRSPLSARAVPEFGSFETRSPDATVRATRGRGFLYCSVQALSCALVPAAERKPRPPGALNAGEG